MNPDTFKNTSGARKVGSLNSSKTRKWDGKRWVPVGTKSKAKPSITSASGTGTGRSRASRSTTKTTTTTIPASKRPADMRKGQVYGTDSKSTRRNWSKPHGQVSSKPSLGDHKSATKPSAKPTPTRSSSSSSSSYTRSSSFAKSTAAPSAKQSSSMDANMAAWAKANPALAKKVKKGQSGYAAIQKALGKGGSTSTGNHRGAGNGAPGAQTRTTNTPKPAGKVPARQEVTKGIRAGARTDARNQVLNGARTAAKADKSLGQRDSLKTTSAKPLAVPLNQIPKNLNSPAGKKYLADLDAGRLTRRRR